MKIHRHSSALDFRAHLGLDLSFLLLSLNFRNCARDMASAARRAAGYCSVHYNISTRGATRNRERVAAPQLEIASFQS
jgi:hypothetical protein